MGGVNAAALGATVGVIFVGMLIGGVTGFGSSLVATPFLLLLGVPLPLVVTANLTLVIATRAGGWCDGTRTSHHAAQ